MMREIRYFGLGRWSEVIDFLGTLHKRGEVSNIGVRLDRERMLHVVEWDENLIDLENK